MSNRRIKSLVADEDDLVDAYDDDDYYDDHTGYQDGPASIEMTDDDREQMRIGSAKVRQTLGLAYSKVPIKDIEDALWHYYYDIDQSVAYIKRTYKTMLAPPNKTTTPSHKEHSAGPRGRLLGGGAKDGKMSKLQALAAKRLQQAAQKTAEDATGDNYTQSFSRLRLSQAKSGARQAEDRATGATDSPGVEAPQAHSLPSPEDEKVKAEDTTLADQELRAKPSAFASVLTSLDAPFVVDISPWPESSLPLSTSPSFDFSEPSPEDVVTRAQSRLPATTGKTKAKDVAKAADELADAFDGVSMDTVKVKSKNIDVAAEYSKTEHKKAANFVVIGHVDAGKSTLMGRLLFDLGAVDQRTIDMYKKEAESMGKGSFAFAWVLDQGTEERERGVTMDIATNKFDTEKTSFTILDAPGHRDFVPNMLAGASHADFAVLVIDASTGNFESGLRGQTKEHAILVRSIGVEKMIVAVNKMDMVEWSKDRFDDIQQQMLAFLVSAGFQATNISFVPCSGMAGGNIVKKEEDPRAGWYTGPSLVEHLDSSEPYSFALDKPLRMTISDVFRGGVHNPLSVSGRIEAGNLQMGESVLVVPSGEMAHIKAIDVDEEPREWAVAGQNVDLHLSGIDPIHLKRGDVLCSPASPVASVSQFKAKLLVHDYIWPMELDLLRGELQAPAHITKLIATLNKETGEPVKKKPQIVRPQTWARVQMKLDDPIALEPLARIVLRSGGETIATGIVEEIEQI
ncbi:hypothetical protein DV735_g1050, partial [Chaetothyriales sp. CBS 134920]